MLSDVGRLSGGEVEVQWATKHDIRIGWTEDRGESVSLLRSPYVGGDPCGRKANLHPFVGAPNFIPANFD